MRAKDRLKAAPQKQGGSAEISFNVPPINVKVPDIKVPEIKVPDVNVPEIKVPEIDVAPLLATIDELAKAVKTLHSTALQQQAAIEQLSKTRPTVSLPKRPRSFSVQVEDSEGNLRMMNIVAKH